MSKYAYAGVPTTLTEVEYIQSSGTQYIDTGVLPNNAFKIDCEIARNYRDGRADGVCGSYNGSQWGMYLYLADNGKVACAYGTQNVYVADNTDFYDTNKHHYILDLTSSGLTTIIDNTLQSTQAYSAIDNGLNYYLFKCNDGGTGRVASVKMYSFKIYIANVLIRDFVPVLDENNVACLFDKVERKLYYNKGTGTFTAGNTVSTFTVNIARKIIAGYVGVMKKYTPIEYLESTGTQYISTGVLPSANIKTVVDFQFTSLPSATSQGVVGAWDANKGMIFGVQSSSGNLIFRFAFGTSAWAGNSMTADTNRHTVYMNDENGNARLDTTTLAYGSSASSLSYTIGMSLFGFSGAVTYKSYCKIYSCQMYDGNTLIRDFIPVLDSDGTPCLYEKVYEKFYYDELGGSFVAGAVSGEPVEFGSVARRLSKGYVGNSNDLASRTLLVPLPIPKGAVSLFHFDGNGYDAVGNYKDSSTGTEQQVQVSSYGTHEDFGGCAKFTANASSIQKRYLPLLPNINNIAKSRAPFTVAFWLYITSGTVYFRYYSGGSDRRYIRIGASTSTLYLDISSGTGVWSSGSEGQGPRLQTSASISITTRSWHHYALTVTDTRIARVFLDGFKKIEADLSTTSFNAMGAQEYELYLGSTSANCYYDEILLSNRALWTDDFEVPQLPYR